MDYWRKYFENAKGDIFQVIQQAILVASTDCPNEFKQRKLEMAEVLFTCQLPRCSGCDGVEVPPPKEEPNGGSEGGQEKESKGACSTNSNNKTDVKPSSISFNEVEALTDLLEEENQTVVEVLRIKEVLVNSMDQSSSVLLGSLRRLELMDVDVQTLMSTSIGTAVSTLRKHPIKEISKLARGLVRSWKAMVSEWVAVTEAAKGSKDSPDSVNPSGIDEEDFGLLSPPLDEGAFFVPETNTMELSKFFDDMDDLGNLDGDQIDDENRRTTNFRKENNNTEKRRPHFPREQNVPPKDNNSHPPLKQEAVVRQINPSNPDSGIANHSKLSLNQNANQETNLHHRVETTRTQRTLVSGQPSEQHLEEKLEMAKRKLHQGYQQAENAKKQRTIQVMELHDLPKQGFGSNNNNAKSSHARPGSRNWGSGRR